MSRICNLFFRPPDPIEVRLYDRHARRPLRAWVKILAAGIVFGMLLLLASQAFASPAGGRPLHLPGSQAVAFGGNRFDVSLRPQSVAGLARHAAMARLSGLHERHNRRDLRRVLGADPVKKPWCGYAMAYAVEKSGGQPVAGYPRAIAWRHFGRPVERHLARKGDIAVIRTRRGHHVTLVDHVAGGRLYGLGGNQSNRVKISTYRLSAVVAVRR
ncbi:MAG: hypothetical protein KDJ69_10075 [Nitratireductor sp.]|nr:hypothetical protein [Nitratireductor sp.]